jgi:hypothetical protein
VVMIKRLSDMEQFGDGSGGGDFVVISNQLKKILNVIVNGFIKPTAGLKNFFRGNAVVVSEVCNVVRHQASSVRSV